MDVTATEVGASAPKLTDARWIRRPRIPTPVVVAALGLVLGSWLLPAFTRQWDDRQKAGEVKATIIAQIASAAGGALLDAHEASMTPRHASPSGDAIPAAGEE